MEREEELVWEYVEEAVVPYAGAGLKEHPIKY